MISQLSRLYGIEWVKVKSYRSLQGLRESTRKPGITALRAQNRTRDFPKY